MWAELRPTYPPKARPSESASSSAAPSGPPRPPPWARPFGRGSVDEELEPVAGSSSDVPAEWLRISRRRLESSAEQIAMRTRARGDPRWRAGAESEAEIRSALLHALDTDLLAFSLGQQERSDIADTAVQTLSFARGNLSMKSVHWNPHHSGLVILGRPVQVTKAGGWKHSCAGPGACRPG